MLLSGVLGVEVKARPLRSATHVGDMRSSLSTFGGSNLGQRKLQTEPIGLDPDSRPFRPSASGHLEFPLGCQGCLRPPGWEPGICPSGPVRWCIPIVGTGKKAGVVGPG